MSPEKKPSRAEMFLKYDYPETKDMCKQFLTLTTTVLVISLTFSDKIVGFSAASSTAKWLTISSWTSLLLAIIFCGLGLLFVTKAAGEATYDDTKNDKRVSDAYKMIVTAGGFFILGLILLIGTAIFSTYSSTISKEHKAAARIELPKLGQGHETINISSLIHICLS
ncbi:MAG: hypothetical protein JWP81_2892 [Ferruginibacter sp.]|nr:hypothetical protein [Ferruginibacter sp.]